SARGDARPADFYTIRVMGTTRPAALLLNLSAVRHVRNNAFVMMWKLHLLFASWFLMALAVVAAPLPSASSGFLEEYCLEFYDGDAKKGGFDLTLKFDLLNPQDFARWVMVYDRVSNGEMPPKKK